MIRLPRLLSRPQSFTSRLTSIRMSSTSTIRVRVGGTDLLQDGKMKEIPFPKEDSESKILLSKVSSSLDDSKS